MRRDEGALSKVRGERSRYSTGNERGRTNALKFVARAGRATVLPSSRGAAVCTPCRQRGASDVESDDKGTSI